jgi:large subunit ribosomal protein L19
MITEENLYLERMKFMANLVDQINKKHIKPNVPEFRVGDIVRVDVWVKEGKKERIQAFEGIVIAKKGSGVSETFSVRKKSGSVGVVRVFPVNAPTIDKITVVKKGMVRRAKLNFIKNMRKEYKVKERNSSVKEEA